MPETSGKSKYYLLFCLGNIAIIWLLVIVCYSHRSVSQWAIIRKPFSGSKWKQTQRPTREQSEESEISQNLTQSQMGCLHQIFPPSGLSKLFRRRGGKILRARGEEGHQVTRPSSLPYIRSHTDSMHIHTISYRQYAQALPGWGASQPLLPLFFSLGSLFALLYSGLFGFIWSHFIIIFRCLLVH